MKKLILSIICIIFLSGCGNDPVECLQSVQKEYPDAQIVNAPGYKFTFIVKYKNGEVWWVEATNITDNNISNQVRIFKASE